MRAGYRPVPPHRHPLRRPKRQLCTGTIPTAPSSSRAPADAHGPGGLRKCRTPLPNTPDPVGAVGRCRITHPFHPLRDCEIEVACRRRNWREDRVYFRNRNGRLRSVPAAWTSLGAPDPFLLASKERAHFRPCDLLRLADFIRRFRESKTSATQTPRGT